jgi:hypothetical protein
MELLLETENALIYRAGDRRRRRPDLRPGGRAGLPRRSHPRFARGGLRRHNGRGWVGGGDRTRCPSDINAARAALADRGVDVGEVQDLGGGPVRPLQRSGRERLDLAAAALLGPRRADPGRTGPPGRRGRAPCLPFPQPTALSLDLIDLTGTMKRRRKSETMR